MWIFGRQQTLFLHLMKNVCDKGKRVQTICKRRLLLCQECNDDESVLSETVAHAHYLTVATPVAAARPTVDGSAPPGVFPSVFGGLVPPWVGTPT